jgi:predicted  nucleic acid-binding Zn-ribbon protein
MPAPRRTVGSVLNKLIERVNSNIRRLRILEQESSIYKTRLTSAEQEIMSQRNQVMKSIKDINDKISRQEDRIAAIENTVKEIISQFKKVTTTSKIKELEELIEIYNPIKSQFVTREEVERIIEERLRE